MNKHEQSCDLHVKACQAADMSLFPFRSYRVLWWEITGTHFLKYQAPRLPLTHDPTQEILDRLRMLWLQKVEGNLSSHFSAVAASVSPKHCVQQNVLESSVIAGMSGGRREAGSGTSEAPDRSRTSRPIPDKHQAEQREREKKKTTDLLVEFEPGDVAFAVHVLEAEEPDLPQAHGLHHLEEQKKHYLLSMRSFRSEV